MNSAVKPGDLVKAALAVFGLGLIYRLAAYALDLPYRYTADWTVWIVWIPVVALLLIAGIAKAVQVGVRSARDE